MSARVSAAGTLLVLALASPAGASGTSDKAFDARYREALANQVSSEGAGFDAALARAMDTPSVRAALARCSDASPGDRAVHGYFTFLAVGAYQLELRPAGQFATCVERALEERTGLPEPPRYPWVNEFSFKDASVPDAAR